MERYQNLKEEVDDSVPGYEISSLQTLLDGKLARWSTASCALALACRHFISKEEKEEAEVTYLHE